MPPPKTAAARRATFRPARGPESPSRAARTLCLASIWLILLFILPLLSPAADPPALHTLYLSHDLRTATLVTAAPSPATPDSFSVLARRDSVPVDVSYLYDGVRFDPFPRNPRTDPTFGTGSTEAVDTQITLTWPSGHPALPGPVRFFKGEANQPLFCLGTAPDLPPPSPDAPLAFILPSASGLSARRTRTSFQPSPDHSTALETFEITLQNDTPSTVPVTVVEHLLRSPDWEIVSSSVRQTPDRPSSLIRMGTTLPPYSTKPITYTVRYQFSPSPRTDVFHPSSTDTTTP